ncbi:uncharacterized protein LOC129735900 [Falco cherrug]|uniref:uncharacterized protein LOC129735900 n=1 Tax=Falco cherrug TaxID=345164 RepID=UPI0024799AC8|nr:uncharacterized protein LOC129735900 [Falco cherrug]
MLSIPQGDAKRPAPLQDTRPCLLPDLSAWGAGRQAAQRAQGHIQLAALPHSLPSPSPPAPTHHSGSAGPRAIVSEQTRSKGIHFAWWGHPTLPSTGWARPAAQPGTGMESALAPSREPGLPEELGLSEAWEAWERWTLDPGAGCGPAGAQPAQTGSCYQLMAAWQRAQSKDQRHFRWPRRGGRGEGTPGREAVMPYAGKALLCIHTVGDHSSALPDAPRPSADAGTPHLLSLCFPKPFQLEGPQLCQPRWKATYSCLFLDRQKPDKRPGGEQDLAPEHLQGVGGRLSPQCPPSHHAVGTPRSSHSPPAPRAPARGAAACWTPGTVTSTPSTQGYRKHPKHAAGGQDGVQHPRQEKPPSSYGAELSAWWAGTGFITPSNAPCPAPAIQPAVTPLPVDWPSNAHRLGGMSALLVADGETEARSPTDTTARRCANHQGGPLPAPAQHRHCPVLLWALLRSRGQEGKHQTCCRTSSPAALSAFLGASTSPGPSTSSPPAPVALARRRTVARPLRFDSGQKYAGMRRSERGVTRH